MGDLYQEITEWSKGVQAASPADRIPLNSTPLAYNTAFRNIGEGLAQLGGAVDTIEHSRRQPAGTVRVTLPRMAFARFFLPRLADFSARYPEVGVEFALDDHLVDLVAEGFDVGVRMGEQIAADMVALPLGPITRLVTIGAPAYFVQRPMPDRPEALAGHECSRYRYASSGRLSPWQFQRDGQPLEVDVSGRFIINDLAAEIDLARSGLALVQTIEALVAEDLRSGRLVSVLDDYALSLGSLYLYFPSRAHMPPRLRVFIDHFKA